MAVNVHPQLRYVLSDAKRLKLLGYDLPPPLVSLTLQYTSFQRNFNFIQYLLKFREGVYSKLRPNVAALFSSHISFIDGKFLAAQGELTWSTLELSGHLEKLEHFIHRLDDLVQKTADIEENRIATTLRTISRTQLLDLPRNQQFSLLEFIGAQETSVKSRSVFLNNKNLEVLHALEDMIRVPHSAVSEDHLDVVVHPSAIQALVNGTFDRLYVSFRSSLRTSLRNLKNRIRPTFGGGLLGIEDPFFNVDVVLEGNHIVVSPSLEELQEAINRTVVITLRSIKRLNYWPPVAGQVQVQSAGIFDRLGGDLVIVKAVLQLTGSIEATKMHVSEYLESFDGLSNLWTDDRAATLSSFMESNPNVDEFVKAFERYAETEAHVDELPVFHKFGPLKLSTNFVKSSLKQLCRGWKSEFSSRLLLVARAELERVMKWIRMATSELSREIMDLEDIRAVMNTLEEIQRIDSDVDAFISPVERMYDVLHRSSDALERDEMESVSDLRVSWKKLVRYSISAKESLVIVQNRFKKQLSENVREFAFDVSLLCSDFDQNGPVDVTISPEDAIVRLKRFQGVFSQKDGMLKKFNGGEELFSLPVTSFPEFERMRTELQLMDQLYALFVEAESFRSSVSATSWPDVAHSLDVFVSDLNSLWGKYKRLPRSVRPYPAHSLTKQSLDMFQELFPLLKQLSTGAMRPRHWLELGRVTSSSLPVDVDLMKVSHLIAANLLEHKITVEEIATVAVKELQLETRLNAIGDEWAEQVFTFTNFKNRGPIILKGQETQEMLEKLEDAQMVLGSFLNSRYCVAFKDVVSGWVAKLSTVLEILEQWVVVQSMWIYLEAVFSSVDIAKQLPQEAKRFQNIDRSYMKLVSKAFETRFVLQYCIGNDSIKQMLPHLTEQLEMCQRSLTGYLETKRNVCPRFFFVSDPVLLEILSQSSDPQAIQPHLLSIFDNVNSISFDKESPVLAIGIHSSEGEQLPLLNSFLAEGSVEDWLKNLETSVADTLRSVISDSVREVSHTTVCHVLKKQPAQAALLALQVYFTTDVESSIGRIMTEKGAMQNCLKRQDHILSDLAALSATQLIPLTRMKVETLITIQVHLRDVAEELMKKKIKDPNDFEWQKQSRFYWNEKGTLIKITDVEFVYCLEYIGCRERLVVTPLTDRAYVSLAQSVGLFYGGAPSGPAGTGKTETVKDLGRSLGKFVVVFNCSDQMDFRALGKIFKGLSQSGCWGDFDEFNRIELEVLSVVSQQIQCILNAMRESRESFTFTDGQLIRLDLRTGFFITTNPGYAGRQELPENLKTLFRGVAMMVPDRAIIIRVRLAAAGFQTSQELSRKFHSLYRLCEQQLSKQTHYDFGLRNILSVLRTAGNTKRSAPNTDETLLLMRTLREMNSSKFVAEDVPLFLSLLDDLFPGVSAEKVKDDKFEGELRSRAAELNLQLFPTFSAKVSQLYDTSLVRHGMMLVGPPYVGKSACLALLVAVLSALDVPTKEVRMNPKAITTSQMFGRLDPISNDWTDGIFSSIWRRAMRTRSHNTWIVLDGPVDTIWIENLNSVLDDNKLLTLANGDRIPMTSNTKLLFEVENLNNASPATVSRAGIVFLPDSSLGYRPLIASWLASKKPALVEILKSFFDNTIPNLFDFLLFEARPLISLTPGQYVSLFLSALGSMLKELDDDESLDATAIQNSISFALAWTFGTVLDSFDRMKYSSIYPSLSLPLPPLEQDENIFDFCLVEKSQEWRRWTAQVPAWEPPVGSFSYSSLFVPTAESTRMHALMKRFLSLGPVLVVGKSGSAKTTVIEQFLLRESAAADDRLIKKTALSFATTPALMQKTLESCVEKRQGRLFGPAGGKKLTLFIDDLSLPASNEWGDQESSELIRQLLELGIVYSLEKPGEAKKFEDLNYVAAMVASGPMSGDIPNRLKKQFFVLGVPLPTSVTVEAIFGSMLSWKMRSLEFPNDVIDVAKKLPSMTVSLLELMQEHFLPTPAKSHYIFNMRELSRVFQGTFLGLLWRCADPSYIVALWLHEVDRVFGDKLVSSDDRSMFSSFVESVAVAGVGASLLSDGWERSRHFVSFMKDIEQVTMGDKATGDGTHTELVDEDEDDDDGVPQLEEIRIRYLYEAVVDEKAIADRISQLQDRCNESKQFKTRPINLVFFTDAIAHLLRICRVLSLDRGNMLLVGVGGSGRQSLAKLASFICDCSLFQINVSKSYSTNDFLNDIKGAFRLSGVKGLSLMFLLTENDIKEDAFLEYINSVLATGEISGLFQRDEFEILIQDMRNVAAMERPTLLDTNDVLFKFFLERVRQNLHVVLCFSPVGERFRTRARQFPAIFSGCQIDWFYPWTQDALQAVAQFHLSDAAIEYGGDAVESSGRKKELMSILASTHIAAKSLAHDFFLRFRRLVHLTPKSFLYLLEMYRKLYTEKASIMREQSSRITAGLTKLLDAARDIAKMKVVLRGTEAVLSESRTRTNTMMGRISANAAQAERKKLEVQAVQMQLAEDARIVEEDKSKAEKDLLVAKPALDEAEAALKAISVRDIQTLKQLKKPPDLIKRILDGVIILKQGKLEKIQMVELKGRKQYKDSYSTALQLMAKMDFIDSLIRFDKDRINAETVELLEPYLSMDDFTYDAAKKASGNVAGLCSWVRAMKTYYLVAVDIAPLIAALRVTEARLARANQKLQKAVMEVEMREAELRSMKDEFDQAMAEKMAIEEEAARTKFRIDTADALISGLSEEKIRWTEQSRSFHSALLRLVGDVLCGSCVLAYSGPFYSEFRTKLWKEIAYKTCAEKNLAISDSLDVEKFLVEEEAASKWQIEGLPQDQLSLFNGIIVTKGTKWPYLIDPQEQGVSWIKNREIGNNLKIASISDPKLKHYFEDCLTCGKPLLIENVDEDIEITFEAVLTRQYMKIGKSIVAQLGDKEVDVADGFRLFLSTKLPNPVISPEMYAKTAVINFQVTFEGLEEQLLSRVIRHERAELEEQRSALLIELSQNQQRIVDLQDQLLDRLSKSKANLVEDDSLVAVLKTTRETVKDAKEKLTIANDTKLKISLAREDYRPVATRGSILYMVMMDMANFFSMYQCSLAQVLRIFDHSMSDSQKAFTVKERIGFIIDLLTMRVIAFFSRGLYERHRQLFLSLLAFRVQLSAGNVSPSDYSLFLKAGSALDISTQRVKPVKWISDRSWLNVVQLVSSCVPFRRLDESLKLYEQNWQSWIEADDIEKLSIPPIEEYYRPLTEFQRLLLIRCLREDKTSTAVRLYISAILGPKFVEPTSLNIDKVYIESDSRTPLLFLLSQGSDPLAIIESLAKKLKAELKSISMGQGQEPLAKRMITNAVSQGHWVILQNGHLGLRFMNELEPLLSAVRSDDLDPNFRLWIATEPHDQFPINLLHMSIKMTNDPPSGIKAGMQRIFNWMTQDFLESYTISEWRSMLFSISLLHAVVQERRKFGAIGWNVCYEFNHTDLVASLSYLHKHFGQNEGRRQSLSWHAMRYMVSEIQYGGKITDEFDRRLFSAYGDRWVGNKILNPEFEFFRGFRIPPVNDIVRIREYLSAQTFVNETEIIGLSSSADIAVRQIESSNLLSQLLDLEPKESMGLGSLSREDTVMPVLSDILSRLPENFYDSDADLHDKMKKLGGARPFNIFLRQELRLMENVTRKLRDLIATIQGAVNGTGAISASTTQAINAFYDAKIPDAVRKISWEIKALGLWMTSYQDRVLQLKNWLQLGRPHVFWISGFFNPHAFLTAVLQESGKRKELNLALDQVFVSTEVTRVEKEDVKDAAPEGALITGMFLEGATWDRKLCKIVDSPSRNFHTSLPVIHCAATAEKRTDSLTFSCPVYKTVSRTMQNYVLDVELKTDDPPQKWILKGTACLLSKDS